MPTMLSIFSGIGGFDLAFESAGFRTLAFVEFNGTKQIILRAHWPDIPLFGDIDQFDCSEFLRTYGRPDVIAGGPPCQASSLLGARLGTSDDRWKWPQAIRLARELRPRYCVYENPTGVLSVESGRAPTNQVSGKSVTFTKPCSLTRKRAFKNSRRDGVRFPPLTPVPEMALKLPTENEDQRIASHGADCGSFGLKSPIFSRFHSRGHGWRFSLHAMTFYRIANWSTLYENNRTRELKSLSWVPFPNSHDGDGYTALMSHKNAEALLGAFVVIVQVASKCDPRGTLLRGPAMPHTAASLARITRFSEKTINQCLQVCSDPEIGWIMCVNTNENDDIADDCDDTAGECGNPADGCLEGKGKNGIEGNGTLGATERPSPTTKTLSQDEWLKKLASDPTYEGVDVPIQFGRMENWCRVNHKQPSRRRFVNWLNRCDRPMLNGVSGKIDHSKGF